MQDNLADITATQAVSKSSIGIGLFAILAAGVIALTQVTTEERIEDNIRAAESRALFEIYPENIDPDLYEHVIELEGQALNLGAQVIGFQAIVDGQVQGVILPVRTLEGYSGEIDLLVGINTDSTIQGVRVVRHRETPGLGDNIELAKSDWILSFNGKTREREDDSNWAVIKDGGQFDQFTGATITPRAIVGATALALDYFEAHPELLVPVKAQEESEDE